MPYVEFYQTTATGQRTMGRVILTDEGQIRYDRLPPLLVQSLEQGVGRTRLTPDDGLAFMEALQAEFSGSYVRASGVQG